jgi:hypothetical protein
VPTVGGGGTQAWTFGFSLSLIASDMVATWTVSEVSNLLRKCNLMQQADAVDENSIDGKTFLDLTQDELRSAIEEGGLGLKPLQLKRMQKELEVIEVSTSTPPSFSHSFSHTALELLPSPALCVCFLSCFLARARDSDQTRKAEAGSLPVAEHGRAEHGRAKHI